MRIWLLITNDPGTWLDLDEKEEIQCKGSKFVKKGDITLIYKKNPHNKITHIFIANNNSYFDYKSEKGNDYLIDIINGVELSSPIKFTRMQKILKLDGWKKKKKETCIKIPIGKWRKLKEHIIEKNSHIKSKIEEFEKDPGKKQEYVDILNQRSFNYYMNQDYENALKCSDKALSFNSKDITALMNKGKIYGAMNEFYKALECFDEILAIDETNKDALINKGRVYGTLTKHNEALIYFEEVLKKDPDNTEALLYKGITLARISKYKESTKCFDKILIKDPGNVDVQSYKNHFFGLKNKPFTIN